MFDMELNYLFTETDVITINWAYNIGGWHETSMEGYKQELRLLSQQLLYANK